MMRDGAQAAAELELAAWTRQADCPGEAKAVFAASLAQRGRCDDARRVLAGASGIDEMKLLISVLISAGLDDAARRLGRKLHQRRGHHPSVTRWLVTMNVPGSRDLPAAPDAMVEKLAAELAERPGLIETLTTAQKHEPRPESVLLLRRAGAMLVKGYQGDEVFVTLCRALADLAVLAGDLDDARRWAHRGLKADPYCAKLALVLSELSDEPGVGPAARQVLARVARKYPHYPDVRAAMIRRAAADGRPAAARRRLAAWLRRDPDSPTALRLKKELAA